MATLLLKELGQKSTVDTFKETCQLLRYDRAKKALWEARRFDDVRNIRNVEGTQLVLGPPEEGVLRK